MDNDATITPHDQILAVPRSPKARAAFIKEEQDNVVQLCVASSKGVLKSNTASAATRTKLRRLALFMSWMEKNVEILNALSLEQTLRKIFDDPRFHFEGATRKRARAVYKRCQLLATIEHLPHPDHPIYGTKGIMYGVLLWISKKKKDLLPGSALPKVRRQSPRP
jgi:hypothetical protein